MRHELKSRLPGFLEDARGNRLLNEAYQDIMERHPWPFLESTVANAAPLGVAALRRIIYVVDTTTGRRLRYLHIDSVIEADPELDATGDPEFYWLNNTSINTLPASTRVISVRYVRVPTALANDADDPESLDGFPSRYHTLIVDLAQARAVSEGPNARQPADVEKAMALSALVEDKIARMAGVFLGRGERQTFIVPTGDDVMGEEFYAWGKF